MAVRRTLSDESDPQALCAEVADSLRRGELCVLPTETVYGLTTLPSHAQAADRARRWKGRDPSQPFTWHIADVDQVEQLGVKIGLAAERLIARYWPGPLTLILAGNDGEAISVRQPAHGFTRDVIRACGEPLWLSSVTSQGAPPLIDADDIALVASEDIATIVDDGPSPLGLPSTIVRADGAELEVLREGILSRDEVLSAAADLVLFVCTGKTHPSPLAEALAREMTAMAMDVPRQRVLARGMKFASAGTAAMPGMPASEGSLAAGSELGIDLSEHQSQPVSPELCERASVIYCLSESHRSALLAEAPEAADKIKLLRPDNLDIADPFGGDLRIYQRARDEIQAAIGARMSDWWP